MGKLCFRRRIVPNRAGVAIYYREDCNLDCFPRSPVVNPDSFLWIHACFMRSLWRNVRASRSHRPYPRAYLCVCSLASGALLSLEIATGVSKRKERQRRRYPPPRVGPMFHECYIEPTDSPERLRRLQLWHRLRFLRFWRGRNHKGSS